MHLLESIEHLTRNQIIAIFQKLRIQEASIELDYWSFVDKQIDLLKAEKKEEVND